MPNPFDQFDAPSGNAQANPFDQFDAQHAAPSTPITRMDKFVKGLRDPVDGGAQLLTNMLPDSVVNAGNKLNNWLADKTGLVGKLPEGGVDQQVKDAERAYQNKRATAGETGFDGYRVLGNILNPVNMVGGAGITTATTLPMKMGIGGASGALSGALSPVESGDFATEKAKQIGLGGAFGAAFPAVAAGVSRIISPKASVNPNLNLLKGEGVTPTVGQTLGGRWNSLEEKLQSVPILGDAISSARRSANEEFETAAYNRALRPIGESLPPGLSGRDAVNFAEGKLRSTYDDVLNKIGAIAPDAQFNQKVSNLTSMVNGLVMPKAEKEKFTSALNDISQSINGNGVMTSDAFKALESSLGSDAQKLSASTNIYEGKLAPAVKQLQAELRDMLARQAGSSATDLKNANAGWANFKRVQNASSKLGADDGSFTPAQFQNAVRALDKSKDKGAFARGSAVGQDLGDAGKSVLGSKVPNSFTTDRALIAGGALGSYFVNPGLPIGLLGGAAMYSRPMQSLLGAAVASRPQAASQAAKAFNKYSASLLPLSTQIGLGLLK